MLFEIRITKSRLTALQMERRLNSTITAFNILYSIFTNVTSILPFKGLAVSRATKNTVGRKGIRLDRPREFNNGKQLTPFKPFIGEEYNMIMPNEVGLTRHIHRKQNNDKRHHDSEDNGKNLAGLF